MRSNHSQANEATPILTKEGEPLEVVLLEPLSHPLDLSLITIVFSGGGFITLTIAHKIRSDNSKPSPIQDWDHLSVEVTPHRLTVQAEH